LLFEPAEGTAGVENGLTICLERQADIRADEVIGARMAWNGAAVMIGQAHFHGGDSELVKPAADVRLLFPAGIPLRENYDGGAGVTGLEKLCVDEIVFRPRRFDGAGKGKDAIFERLVGCSAGGVPLVTVSERVLDKMIEVSLGVGLVGGTADVFESPGKGQRPSIRFLRPTHMLVAAYFSF